MVIIQAQTKVLDLKFLLSSLETYEDRFLHYCCSPKKGQTLALQGCGGGKMVYLDKDQLKQVEYLFDQSSKGVHVLFQNEDIKRVLSSPTEDMDFFTFENVERIQTLLSNFVAQESLQAKLGFLEDLDQETYDLLLRTYFNIVENSIFEQCPERH